MKTTNEMKKYINGLGYMVLTCMDGVSVMVARSFADGRNGYRFDSIAEAYDYFTSK